MGRHYQPQLPVTGSEREVIVLGDDVMRLVLTGVPVRVDERRECTIGVVSVAVSTDGRVVIGAVRAKPRACER